MHAIEVRNRELVPNPEIGGSGYKLNSTSPHYDAVKLRFSRQIIARLAPLVPSDASILEIGPGAGHFARECLENGYAYRAFDASEEISGNFADSGIEVGQALCPPVPLPDRGVDLFYSSMVLEHMTDASAATEFVREASRVVRPGGIVCLMFPNAQAMGNLFWEMDYTHSYFTSPRRVSQLCDQCGLEIIDVDRMIGWFWARSTRYHHVIRAISNLAAIGMNAAPVTILTDMTGMAELSWKIRKTLFESSLVIARRPASTPSAV